MLTIAETTMSTVEIKSHRNCMHILSNNKSAKKMVAVDHQEGSKLQIDIWQNEE